MTKNSFSEEFTKSRSRHCPELSEFRPTMLRGVAYVSDRRLEIKDMSEQKNLMSAFVEAMALFGIKKAVDEIIGDIAFKHNSRADVSVALGLTAFNIVELTSVSDC